MAQFRHWPDKGTEMRNIILFSLFMIGAAMTVPQLINQTSGSEPKAGARSERVQAPQAGYRSLTLYRSGAGHFETDAVVNGRHIAFLVDTGASVVVLRESEVARLGIHPARQDYRVAVATANGQVMAAPTELNRIEIGSLEVRNVAALILPDKVLAQNLLGMSFLSRVRFEHRNGRLILEQ